MQIAMMCGVRGGMNKLERFGFEMIAIIDMTCCFEEIFLTCLNS